MTTERKFIIDFKMAPGDVSMLTALVRDLKLTYGDRYLIDVRTNFPAIWRHNPYLTPLEEGGAGVELLRLGSQPAMSKRIRESNKEHVHFVTYFHHEFHLKTKIQVPCLYPRPDLHLSKEEKQQPLIEGRYWVIVPGGKLDMTNKIWSQVRYQEVVDKLRPWGLQFVQEGSTKQLCVHPPLDNVLNMVGRTSVRDLIVNIYHAEGVICGITFQMHIAAALSKPCVVLGGGRENPWWEAYRDDWKAFGDKAESVPVPHQYLHTLGLLPCCKSHGCWKQRVVRLNDHSRHDKSLCQLPVSAEASQIVPKCLNLITSDHVAEAVMSYYEDGTLKPIGKPTHKYSQPPGKNTESTTAKPELPGGMTVIDLFAPSEKNEEPENPIEVEEIGALFTAAPQVRRGTEQENTGQARPGKAAGHAFPPQMQPDRPDPQPPKPAQQHPGSGLQGLLQHPRIGGKVTICALLYGGENDNHDEFHHLHRRCLGSIVETVPPSCFDLRVGMNQVGPKTQAYLKTLPITKTYPDYKQRRKYPAMRAMFHDTVDPITTPWVIWFDDDSYVENPNWLRAWAECLISQPPDTKIGLMGQIKYHPFASNPHAKNPQKWFEEGKWFRGRPYHNRRGLPAPNGNHIQFVTGGFWVASMEAIRAANVPDERINHNGGDITIGAQIYQQGYEIKQFNDGKKLIHTSKHARRGYHESFPWSRY